MKPFEPYRQILRNCQPAGITGRVSGLRGLTVSVSDFAAPVGAVCRITRGERSIEARVIGFAADQTLVMPMGVTTGICRGDRVELISAEQTVGVGPNMLGRVLDGAGRPIDDRGDLRIERQVSVRPEPIDPMRRTRITEPMVVGVRPIDAMLTAGQGQRMGIFSGPGVGKSVLLGMIGRYTTADVTVIAMIGERGREVRDFIEKDLGPEGLERSVVVVSTGDEPPLLRVQAAAVAAAIAEYFRDRGCGVLLLMDSLTRLAMAQRQIGLVAGEPPATRGYPPSVFNLIPELLERCGRTETGSITGFFTVLVEDDDMSDPVGDAVRAATDGHVYLSRELANHGHWPAIDVLQSVSRVMRDVIDPDHRHAAAEIHRLIALHSEIEDLLRIGAYRRGADAEYDLAVQAMPEIRRFLTQRIDESADFAQTRERMIEIAAWAGGLRRQGRAARPAVATS